MEPTASGTLTGRTVAALRWSYASTFINAVIQIVLTAILARLVEPRAFGLVAMGGLSLAFGSYFALGGLGPAIVQRPSLTDEEVRASFWMSLALGTAFLAGFWVGAPTIAAVFREPQAVGVVRALAFTFILAGASATALALLRRQLRFREIAIVEVGSYLLGYAGVGVVLALQGRGVWALVCASLAQAALMAIGSYAAARHSVRPVRNRAAYRSMLGFGSRISLVGFVEFLGGNIDNLAVGRFLGAAPLGLYGRALALGNMPLYYISNSMLRVLAPSFAALQYERDRLHRTYESAVILSGAVVFSLGWFISGAAEQIVAVLLGPRWGGVVPVLRLVAVAAPLTTMTSIAAAVLEAVNELRTRFIIRAIHLPFFGLALLVASRYGLVGFGAAFALSETSLFLVYLVVITRFFRVGAGVSASAYLPVALVGGCTVAPVLLLSAGARAWGGSALAWLSAMVVAALLGFAFAVLRLARGRVWRELRNRASAWGGVREAGWLAGVLRRADALSACPVVRE